MIKLSQIKNIDSKLTNVIFKISMETQPNKKISEETPEDKLVKERAKEIKQVLKKIPKYIAPAAFGAIIGILLGRAGGEQPSISNEFYKNIIAFLKPSNILSLMEGLGAAALLSGLGIFIYRSIKNTLDRGVRNIIRALAVLGLGTMFVGYGCGRFEQLMKITAAGTITRATKEAEKLTGEEEQLRALSQQNSKQKIDEITRGELSKWLLDETNKYLAAYREYLNLELEIQRLNKQLEALKKTSTKPGPSISIPPEIAEQQLKTEELEKKIKKLEDEKNDLEKKMQKKIPYFKNIEIKPSNK